MLLELPGLGGRGGIGTPPQLSPRLSPAPQVCVTPFRFLPLITHSQTRWSKATRQPNPSFVAKTSSEREKNLPRATKPWSCRVWGNSWLLPPHSLSPEAPRKFQGGPCPSPQGPHPQAEPTKPQPSANAERSQGELGGKSSVEGRGLGRITSSSPLALASPARSRHSRPEVLHSVKLGDQMQVVLPGSAAVILEEPQRPPGGRGGQEEAESWPSWAHHQQHLCWRESHAPSGTNEEMGFGHTTPTLPNPPR